MLDGTMNPPSSLSLLETAVGNEKKEEEGASLLSSLKDQQLPPSADVASPIASSPSNATLLPSFGSSLLDATTSMPPPLSSCTITTRTSPSLFASQPPPRLTPSWPQHPPSKSSPPQNFIFNSPKQEQAAAVSAAAPPTHPTVHPLKTATMNLMTILLNPIWIVMTTLLGLLTFLCSTAST
ncbi:hypothetical protein BC829DRAFT_170683 [Chytridium lagenaria]|nr:hypothetical protein BC829DRAFT_170683 [Chytridium lagenaria]